MAAPTKKRVCHPNFEEENEEEKKKIDSESSSENEDAEESEGESMEDSDSALNEDVQVEFEAFAPQGSDFDGVKLLLQQLFLKSHVSTSDLADVVLQQNHVGSVIKQSENDEDMEDDDEDEDVVFGVSTVINLTSNPDVPCIHQIRNLLCDQCKKHGTDDVLKQIQSALNSPGKNAGLLVNERLVNIPPQIAAPLFENLSKEIESAKAKSPKFSFDEFFLISKVYKLEDDEETKKKKRTTTVFCKPEEEIIFKEASASYEYCIADESDTGLEGDWNADDDGAQQGMKPFRRIALFPATKLDSIAAAIRDAFGNAT